MAKYKLDTSYGSPTTLLTTELNSLPNNAITAASSAYDNTSKLDLFADFTLDETFASAPSGGSLDLLYAVSIDGGSTYSDYAYGGSFDPTPPADTSAHKLRLLGFAIPAGLSKYKVQNNGTGQALVSSGNALKLATYQTQ